MESAGTVGRQPTPSIHRDMTKSLKVKAPRGKTEAHLLLRADARSWMLSCC
jgi:hypothetical protein